MSLFILIGIVRVKCQSVVSDRVITKALGVLGYLGRLLSTGSLLTLITVFTSVSLKLQVWKIKTTLCINKISQNILSELHKKHSNSKLNRTLYNTHTHTCMHTIHATYSLVPPHIKFDSRFINLHFLRQWILKPSLYNRDKTTNGLISEIVRLNGVVWQVALEDNWIFSASSRYPLEIYFLTNVAVDYPVYKVIAV